MRSKLLKGRDMKKLFSYTKANGDIDWEEIRFDILFVGVMVLGVYLGKTF